VTDPASPRRASEWRRVLIPAEHGGWAFVGEPILLGLLVAPSIAGAALAAAALTAFLARQPLRLLVADRRGQRRYPRTAVAEAAFALLGTGGLLAAGAGILLAQGPVLVALGPMALLAAVALGFELRRRAREAAAEMTAALALGGAAMAIALAGGATVQISAGLWVVLAARTLPAILYVRARLRIDRGEPAGIAVPLAAHALALVAVLRMASQGFVPWLAAAAMALLAARAVHGLSALRPRWRAVQLGVSEIVFGLLTVLAVAVGLRPGE
jgi:hypothetical protein